MVTKGRRFRRALLSMGRSLNGTLLTIHNIPNKPPRSADEGYEKENEKGGAK